MTYPPKYWAGPEDTDRALDLLRSINFWHLSGYSGCLCGSIKIFAFEIDVSCRKSENTITVKSRYPGIGLADCQKIAEEIKHQIITAGDPVPDIVTEIY
jgi:hypothetical protein